MGFDDEMMRALEADGEKLRQLTGEDHGPFCPDCMGTGMRDTGGTHPWGETIFVPCDCSSPTTDEATK